MLRSKPPPLTFFSLRQSSTASNDTPRSSSNRMTTSRRLKTSKKHTILMVSDFFYPRLGGVEMHIWSLSQCLLSQGHKVVVLTRQYDDRRGVRWMTNGLKVYYLPALIMGDAVALPTNLFNFPMFRQIVIREGITIVHAHQATAMMGHACMFHAGTMGIPCVYTDHSLFSFNELLPILLHIFSVFSLQGASHCIAVSHTCRENLCMRAHLQPNTVSTIPNAIDPKLFVPDMSRRGDGLTVDERVNIVILSRLVYRKGIHIAVRVIPRICAKYPNAYFIIGGDGDKKLMVLEMIEQHRLFDRVEILGAIKHSDVRSVLTRGHIFLNCSLTESFCIAILEAACCGLHVVSTNVGGVPEVLPPDDITYAAAATPDAVEMALDTVMRRVRNLPSPWEVHQRICGCYSWHSVARRTVKVYDHVSAMPMLGVRSRLAKYWHAMQWHFRLAVIWIVMTDWLWYGLLCWLWPEKSIEKARNLDIVKWMRKGGGVRGEGDGNGNGDGDGGKKSGKKEGGGAGGSSSSGSSSSSSSSCSSAGIGSGAGGGVRSASAHNMGGESDDWMIGGGVEME